MKKIFALALAALMTASMATVAFAASFDKDPDGVQVGIQPDATAGWTTADGDATKIYKLSSDRAENVVDGASYNDPLYEGGNRLAIPLIVWDDDKDGGDKAGKYDKADQVMWYTKDVDYKKPVIKSDWKVGEADVTVELVKYDDSVGLNGLSSDEYIWSAIITLPENKGSKAVDLAGTIKAGSNSTSAKKGEEMDINLTYQPDHTDANITNEFKGGELASGSTGIVKFDQSEGEIDIDFEDVATFTVDVSSQGKLNMEWNDDFDTDFGKKYDYANLEFIKFEGKPSFNKTGTLYIYAEDKNTFVYEATEDGAKAVDAKWNEDYEAWEIKTRKLTSYVLSDVELDKQTVTEDKNESSKPESGKDNPDTGR